MDPAIIAEQILEGIKQKLEAHASLQDLPGGVHRERPDPFSKAKSPAINFFPMNEAAVPQTIEGIVWTMMVRVAIVARGQEPSSISAQYTNPVHQVMVGLSADDAFDTVGLVRYVQPSNVQYDVLPGDGTALGVVARDYLIEYRTAYDDLTAQG